MHQVLPLQKESQQQDEKSGDEQTKRTAAERKCVTPRVLSSETENLRSDDTAETSNGDSHRESGCQLRFFVVLFFFSSDDSIGSDPGMTSVVVEST